MKMKTEENSKPLSKTTQQLDGKTRTHPRTPGQALGHSRGMRHSRAPPSHGLHQNLTLHGAGVPSQPGKTRWRAREQLRLRFPLGL